MDRGSGFWLAPATRTSRHQDAPFAGDLFASEGYWVTTAHQGTPPLRRLNRDLLVIWSLGTAENAAGDRCGWRPAGGLATVLSMSETLRLTIVYEEGGDGWVVASIPEVPGAHSQGRTRQEARENVIDALQTMLTPDEELEEPSDREALIFTAQP